MGKVGDTYPHSDTSEGSTNFVSSNATHSCFIGTSEPPSRVQAFHFRAIERKSDCLTTSFVLEVSAFT
jgi:hypothetical protein